MADTKYPSCPACQSEEFVIEGLVGYRRWYNSRDEDYSASKIDWDIDYPQKVYCERCKKDTTDAFMEYNILPIYREPPLE